MQTVELSLKQWTNAVELEESSVLISQSRMKYFFKTKMQVF